MTDRATVAARETAHAWDLRAAWATGRVVSVRFDPDLSDVERARGVVVHVSATGATAVLDDGDAGRDGPLLSFPLAAVLSVRKPHFHEPLDVRALAIRSGRVPEPVPGQMALPL